MADADLLGELFRMAECDGMGVNVGVMGGATHTDERGRSIPVAEYAMYNEFGTRRSPPRPAFRVTAEERGDEWGELLGGLLADGVPARAALTRVGGVAVDDIRESIDLWAYPENKPSTIRRKRSGRDNPLVDSGDYMDAVEFVVTEGSER